MNTKNKDIFTQNAKSYFGDKTEEFLNLLNEEPKAAFFLNEKKADKETILSLIDFKYESSLLTDKSYLFLDDAIGKSKVYDLGLIYPQDIESSLPVSFVDTSNIKYAIDLCAAPGGKSINILNRLANDSLLICNDINYKRASILNSNLERLGLDNTIITSLNPEYFKDHFKNYFDLVILDVPCSGEGMIRKYKEILNEYSNANINSLALIQKNLLNIAYELLNKNGQIIYSTCTYSFKEDEDQIASFLNEHEDMELIKLPKLDDITKLEGTIKLSPLNNTEGQFMALLKKKGGERFNNYKYKKTTKNKIVEDFIKDNLDINDYYLYNNNDHYYLSFIPLLKIDNNVLANGIYLGELNHNIFKPAHSLYRANSLINKYKHIYDLNDNEYEDFISGKELKINNKDNYYLLTYKNLSLGFGKLVKGILKIKYPKGLRRVV